MKPDSFNFGGIISGSTAASAFISAAAPSNARKEQEQEFGLISFALGVVTGARSFKVDKLGRLTGIHYPQIWTPVENVAECRKRDEGAYSMSFAARSYTTRDVVDFDRMRLEYVMADGSRISESAYDSIRRTGSVNVPVQSAPTVASGQPTKPKEHSLASCEHGFYAYYDGSDDYHKGGMVSGVVEGYGESLIGTRGFRCMKAKLVALTISKDLAKPVAALVHRNYKDVPQFVTFEQMVKAFPTDSAGMEPAPETDEDFWTRSI